MKKLFITSSGTDIGKTFVVESIARQYLDIYGHKLNIFKPVISGYDEADNDSDIALLWPLARNNGLGLYKYKAPISPDQAALREGKDVVDIDKIVDFIANNEDSKYPTIIEGIGGAFVPLNMQHNVADLIKACQAEAVLVVGSYVGALSHAIATYNAILAQDIKVKAVIITQNNLDFLPTLEETQTSLSNFISSKIIQIPCISNKKDANNLPDLLGLLK